jgi:zinc protease
MRIPTTIHRENIDATILSPQTGEVARFKVTIPVYGNEYKMLMPPYAELLERGTKSKTRKEFAEALEVLGAELSVNSDRIGITITGSALSKTSSAFLRLVGEMLCEPIFSEKEIAQVHTQYLQSLDDERDNARLLAYTTFTQMLYPKDHPYYKPTVASRRAFLKTVTRKTYLDFHKHLFNTRITLSISGPEAAKTALLNLFSSLITIPDIPPLMLSPVSIPTRKVSYQEVASKANMELYIGNTLPLTSSDKAFLPFQFGLAVLGKWGGFSGRLMSTVREKEGLTYMTYARTDGVTKTRSGMWYICTFFTPADLEKGIASTKREIKLIAEKGVTEKEMARFKELLRNQFILAHESDAKALALYHDALCAGMTATDIASQYDAMQELEKQSVNKTLAEYLRADQLVISGAGPIARSRDHGLE